MAGCLRVTSILFLYKFDTKDHELNFKHLQTLHQTQDHTNMGSTTSFVQILLLISCLGCNILRLKGKSVYDTTTCTTILEGNIMNWVKSAKVGNEGKMETKPVESSILVSICNIDNITGLRDMSSYASTHWEPYTKT